MPFGEKPAEDKAFGFEVIKKPLSEEGYPVVVRGCNQCPRSATCAVVGLVLRAVEQFSEEAEIYGLVAQVEGGIASSDSVEVWLETLFNPLRDDSRLGLEGAIQPSLACKAKEQIPERVFDLFDKSPVQLAGHLAADYVMIEGCLLADTPKHEEPVAAYNVEAVAGFIDLKNLFEIVEGLYSKDIDISLESLAGLEFELADVESSLQSLVDMDVLKTRINIHDVQVWDINIQNQDVLDYLKSVNNPDNNAAGHFTGRCGRCHSTNLWSDYMHYGCNTCGDTPDTSRLDPMIVPNN